MVHVSGIILVEHGGATAGQATSVAVNLTIGLSSMVPTHFVLHALLAGRSHFHQESVTFKMDTATGHVSQPSQQVPTQCKKSIDRGLRPKGRRSCLH